MPIDLSQLLTITRAYTAVGTVTQSSAIACKKDGVKHRGRAAHTKQKAKREADGH